MLRRVSDYTPALALSTGVQEFSQHLYVTNQIVFILTYSIHIG